MFASVMSHLCILDGCYANDIWCEILSRCCFIILRCILETMCYKMIHEKSVFANNELSLRDIAVYGFDYDYTLAHYTNELNSLIYRMSLEKLINEYSVSRVKYV